jgi:hypothetical protein
MFEKIEYNIKEYFKMFDNINGQSAAKILNHDANLELDKVQRLSLGKGVHLNYIEMEKVENYKDTIFIYGLIDNLNNLRYIGISKNIKTRFRNHKNTNIDKRTWKNNWVKSVYENKGFIKMIIIDQISYLSNKAEQKADTLEKFWIKTLSEYCELTNYNELFVQTQYEYNTQSIHKNKKHIYVYNKNCEFVEELPSLKDVVYKYKISYSAVSLGISKKRLRKDFYFSFKKLDKFIPTENKPKPNLRKCYQYDLFGNFIAEYESVALASKITGIKQNSIKDCLHDRAKTAYTSIFRKYKADKIDVPLFKNKEWSTRFKNKREAL